MIGSRASPTMGVHVTDIHIDRIFFTSFHGHPHIGTKLASTQWRLVSLTDVAMTWCKCLTEQVLTWRKYADAFRLATWHNLNGLTCHLFYRSVLLLMKRDKSRQNDLFFLKS